MVGRRHRRRGDGPPPRRHLPVHHRVRRRRGRVPRGRAARATRADVHEPPADARVRRSRRADKADADDALRNDRGARHDDAVRRRGRSQERLRARRRAAGEDRSVGRSEGRAPLRGARLPLGHFTGSYVRIAMPSPTVFESTSRRGFLPFSSPKTRLPLPSTTGNTMSLSWSTRSCSSSACTSWALPWTTTSPSYSCFSFVTSVARSPFRTV